MGVGLEGCGWVQGGRWWEKARVARLGDAAVVRQEAWEALKNSQMGNGVLKKGNGVGIIGVFGSKEEMGRSWGGPG